VLGCSKFTAQTNDQYIKYSCAIDGEKQPESEADYVKQGNLHFKKSEYQCQFYACDHAIMLSQQDAEAYSCRGRAYRYVENDIVHGLADLTTAIKLQPDSRNYYSERGDIYQAGEQFDAALADYQKQLELVTAPALKGYTKYDNGGLYFKKGNNDLALSAMNEAVALLPDVDFILEKRARIYLKMGKPDLALADLKKAGEIEAKTAK
jgi:tetratricopeptide (TPR) repeat protein